MRCGGAAVRRKSFLEKNQERVTAPTLLKAAPEKGPRPLLRGTCPQARRRRSTGKGSSGRGATPGWGCAAPGTSWRGPPSWCRRGRLKPAHLPSFLGTQQNIHVDTHGRNQQLNTTANGQVAEMKCGCSLSTVRMQKQRSARDGPGAQRPRFYLGFTWVRALHVTLHDLYGKRDSRYDREHDSSPSPDWDPHPDSHFIPQSSTQIGIYRKQEFYKQYLHFKIFYFFLFKEKDFLIFSFFSFGNNTLVSTH